MTELLAALAATGLALVVVVGGFVVGGVVALGRVPEDPVGDTEYGASLMDEDEAEVWES